MAVVRRGEGHLSRLPCPIQREEGVRTRGGGPPLPFGVNTGPVLLFGWVAEGGRGRGEEEECGYGQMAKGIGSWNMRDWEMRYEETSDRA